MKKKKSRNNDVTLLSNTEKMGNSWIAKTICKGKFMRSRPVARPRKKGVLIL